MRKNISISKNQELIPLNNNKELVAIKNGIYKKDFYNKKSLYYKKKSRYAYTILKENFYSFLFLISYYLYYLSLEKCFEGEDECCKKINWIHIKLVEEILSCFILSLLIELIFYKIISKLHLIHFTIIFIFFYKYSHGLDFNDHGYFNILGFFILLIIILVCLLPFNGFLYFNKNKNKKFIFYYIFSLLVSSTILYQVTKLTLINCKDWPKGLNNTYIYNNQSIYG
jgi:hypothetical protein